MLPPTDSMTGEKDRMRATPDQPSPRAVGGAHLITRDTNLRIDSFNAASGVTLTIVVRSIGFDGTPIVDIFNHAPNTDRSIKTDTYLLSDGWLLSCQVYASSGSPRRGQCFVRVQLIQGLTGATLSLATLVQGYVQDTTALAYPGSAIEPSTAGRGVIRSITGTNPAAGAEISETVPTNARWRLLAIRAIFNADPTVATRAFTMQLDDGSSIYFQSGANVTATASQSPVVQWAAGGGGAASSGTVPVSHIAQRHYLMGGHRIRTTTNNLQAGDDWGAPQYLVEEWIED